MRIHVISDGFIYRIEMLGDKLFYSIKQRTQQGVFNYCAADGCGSENAVESNLQSSIETGSIEEHGIEVFSPTDLIVNQVSSILTEAGADLGGVEYFVREKTQEPCFYDFNPYSNFVANGETLLGFSPEEKYVDFVLDHLG